jgi:hypothetical protein
VPYECALMLVSSGIVPSYSQVVAAARSGVQGVQVWPAAVIHTGQDAAHSASNSDDAAQNALQRFTCQPKASQWPVLPDVLFCNYTFTSVWVLNAETDAARHHQRQLQQQLLAEQLSPAALEDLLWLALSAAPKDVGVWDKGPMHQLTKAVFPEDIGGQRPAITQWQQQVQSSLQQVPVAAQQLLLGLALQRGYVVFAHAAETRLAWRAAPEAVVEALQQHTDNLRRASGLRRSALKAVLRAVALSQSAKQLSAEQVAALMRAAVKSRQESVLKTLFFMPAAAELSAAQFSMLLDTACKHNEVYMLTTLVQKAAAEDVLKGVAPSALLAWLQAAVQLNGVLALEALLATDAAAHLNADAVSALFGQAVDQQQMVAASMLLQYLGIRHDQCQRQQQQQSVRLDAAAVTDYLRALIANSSPSVFTACSMQAVRMPVTGAQVFELVQCTVKKGGWVTAALCALDGAKQLQPAQAVELLLLALQSNKHETARLLLDELPAMQNLRLAANVKQLLLAAAGKCIFTKQSAAQRWGVRLQAQLKQLPWTVIEQAARCALQELGGASTSFKELLQLLEIVQWESNLHLEGRLQAPAEGWEAAAVGRLAVAAVQLQDADTVCLLCQRKAAQRLTTAAIVPLLRAVIAQQQWRQLRQLDGQGQLQQQQQQKALEAVLLLPAAAALVDWPEIVQQVLLWAIHQRLQQPLVSLLVEKLQVFKCLGVLEEMKQLQQQWRCSTSSMLL